MSENKNLVTSTRTHSELVTLMNLILKTRKSALLYFTLIFTVLALAATIIGYRQYNSNSQGAFPSEVVQLDLENNSELLGVFLKTITQTSRTKLTDEQILSEIFTNYFRIHGIFLHKVAVKKIGLSKYKLSFSVNKSKIPDLKVWMGNLDIKVDRLFTSSAKILSQETSSQLSRIEYDVYKIVKKELGAESIPSFFPEVSERLKNYDQKDTNGTFSLFFYSNPTPDYFLPSVQGEYLSLFVRRIFRVKSIIDFLFQGASNDKRLIDLKSEVDGLQSSIIEVENKFDLSMGLLLNSVFRHEPFSFRDFGTFYLHPDRIFYFNLLKEHQPSSMLMINKILLVALFILIFSALVAIVLALVTAYLKENKADILRGI